MGRPAKTLELHIRDGTFRPSRHGSMLGDDNERLPVELETYRDRYLAARSKRERRAIVLDFASAIAEPDHRQEDAFVERVIATVALAPGALEQIERVRARGGSAKELAWRALRRIVDAPPMPAEFFEEPGEEQLYTRFLRACRARGLRRDGLPLRDVAARLGVSEQTVLRDLRELPRWWGADLSALDERLDESGWAWA